MKMTHKKKSHNSFMFNDKHVIGNVFSKFNHSCKPNCYMHAADILTHPLARDIYVDICVYGLWAIHSIEEGEELFVDYVNGQSERHDTHARHYGFTCSCDPEYLAKASLRTNIHVKVCSSYQERDAILIHKIVDEYANTSEAARIAKAHYLGHQGYFERSDGVIVATLPDPNPKRSLMKLKLKLSKKT